MKTFVAVLTSIVLVFVGLAALAQAEVAGRITQVEGTVDFLRGGKLPASAAKLDDSVEVGDVMRTKSLSKAQITFMDNTVVTISPESRIAIEEYMFDPGKGKRSAVLQLFQGLAHVVVSKLFKPAEPDFVVKTQTAVMGVRGTDVGLRIHPNNTTILTFEGHTEVGNIFPEVGDLLFKKAYKIAWGGSSTVHLHTMQGTSVFRGLPPTQPFTITPQDQQQFMGQMGSGLTGQKNTTGGTQVAGGGTSGSGSSSSSSGGGGGSGDTGGGTSGSGTSGSLTSASLGGPDSGLGSTGLSTVPTSITTVTTSGVAGTGLTSNQVINNTIISPVNNPTETPTPTPPPTPPPVTPVTPNFSETINGSYSWTSTSPYTVANFVSTSPASVTRTGVDPGTYTATFNFSATGGTWNPSYNGTFTGTVNGSTITGTLDATFLNLTGGSASISGSSVPFSVDPAGNLTFSLANFTNSGGSSTTITSGTFTQTPVTPPPPPSSTYSISLSNNVQFNAAPTSPGSSTYTVTSSGWAQGQGTWTEAPLYYTSSSSGDRTTTQGTNLTSSVFGSSTGTLSGTVTGVAGSTLTGTGTYSATDSYGNTINSAGNITVDSSGKLTFTYTSGTLSGQDRTASATGTITYTPGSFVTQSLDGAMLQTSTSPYNSANITTTGTGLWAGGSRTGVMPGSFDLSLTGTGTSPWSYWYPANELDNVTATMQGVVSLSENGGYLGALTLIPSTHQDQPFVSSLLPQFQPSPYQFLGENGTNSFPMVTTVTINPDGSASGTLYQNEYQDGKWSTSSYTLNQTVPSTSLSTPVSATYNFQETYNGAMTVGNPSNLGNAYGFGWGQRSFNGSGNTAGTSVYNSYFAAWDNGTWSATSGSLPGSYGSSLAPTGTLDPVAYAPYGAPPAPP